MSVEVMRLLHSTHVKAATHPDNAHNDLFGWKTRPAPAQHLQRLKGGCMSVGISDFFPPN